MILMAFVVFGGILSANAQDQSRKETKLDAQEMTDRMAEDLKLTEEQYTSVLAINKEMVKSVEESGGREADRATKMTIKKEHHAKLNEVLTDEQMAKLKEKRQNRRENHKERAQQRTTE